jgi:hypothetical protein
MADVQPVEACVISGLLRNDGVGNRIQRVSQTAPVSGMTFSEIEGRGLAVKGERTKSRVVA